MAPPIFYDDITFDDDDDDYPYEYRYKRHLPRLSPQDLDALPYDENPSNYIKPTNPDEGGSSYYARLPM